MSVHLKPQVEQENYVEFNYKEWEELSSFFCRDSEYSNFIPFSYYDHTGNEPIFHGNAGYITNNINSKNNNHDFYSFISDIELPEKVDLYCCPNLFKSPKSRTKDNLIAVQNLVIDIDSHEKNLSQPDIKKFADRLIKNLILKPNMVVYTGRGIHLWYKIVPTHVKLTCILDSCVNALIKDIKQYIIEPFSVDEAVCKNYSGLKRFPKSYNSKAGCFGSYKIYHQIEYTVDTILQKLKLHGVKADYIERRKGISPTPKWLSKGKKYNFKCFDNVNMVVYRQKFMQYLLNKYTFDDTTKNRNNFLFAMYITLLGVYEPDDAKEIVLETNSKFEVPLKESEITYCIFSSVDKKPYRLTNSKFFEYVGASQSDIEWYNSHKKTDRTRDKERKERVKSQKEERNKSINYYHSLGLSAKDIADKVGCSFKTVYNVLNS